MRIFFWVILLLTSFTTGFAQKALVIDDNFSSANLEQAQIFYYEDASQSLELSDILTSEYQEKFKQIPRNSPSFGYTSSVFWLRFTLKTSSKINEKYFVEIDYPTLDTLVFYQASGNGQKPWESYQTGDMFPFSARQIRHRNFVFPLHLEVGKAQTFYLRIHSRGSIIAPINIYTESALRQTESKAEGFYGFFYGMMVVMMLYNLLLFFNLKDNSYLLYTLAILGSTTVQASLLGHTVVYLWGDNVWWSNYSVPFLIFVGFGLITLFGYQFLNLAKRHWLNRYLFLGVIGLWFLMAILTLVYLPYGSSIRFAALAALSTAVLLLVSGIKRWLGGGKYARFFVLAWAFYLVGVISMALRNLDVLPDTFIARNSVLIGSVFEVLLLSFALADRINVYRQRSEEAQAEALAQAEENARLVREQNNLLEQKVKERTHELHLKQQEILTQNEELHQQSEEIMAQRDFIQSKNQELQASNQMLEKQERQIRSSIRAAQAIQQAILPYQKKLDDVLQSYFVIYRPKDMVSGDFYWLHQFENQRILVVMDCTGHGVPGAFMSLIANTLLDKIIRVWGIHEPSQILDKLHQEIRIVLRQKYTNNNLGMDACVLLWQAESDDLINLTFAGAKLPIYYYDKAQKAIITVKGSRRSIGGQQNESIAFVNQSLKLSPSTPIYVGSDGFVDQNNKKRRRFGEKNLLTKIQEGIHLPLAEQQTHLEEALDEHMQGTTQRDDILWLGFCLNAKKE